MYLTKVLVVLFTILGSSNIWSVQGLRQRRTTRPTPESTTMEAVIMDNGTEKRYHHKPQDLPQNTPQTQPQNPLQYPPSYLPQNPPHLSIQSPPQNTQQIIPQYPPHFPPQDLPQSPPQYPHQLPPQNLPQYQPQNPIPSPPLVIPQSPTHYPPQILQPTPPQYHQQYPPQKPQVHLPLSPQIILPTPTIIVDQFDNRYSDGSYEFRYELSDESVRYERGYFIYYQQTKILAVKGYYSHRLPDRRYLTVFYTADQFGNRQNSYFSSRRPQLPRSLNVEADSMEDIVRSSEIESSTIINQNNLL